MVINISERAGVSDAVCEGMNVAVILGISKSDGVSVGVSLDISGSVGMSVGSSTSVSGFLNEGLRAEVKAGANMYVSV